ncbi:MAG: TlpA disulfide reductase family protein [Bacteroidota bacterium]
MRHITLLLFMMGSMLIAQEKASIVKGKLTGIPDGTQISLFQQFERLGNRVGIDTLKNGEFYFEFAPESYPANLSLRGGEGMNGKCEIYLEKAEPTMIEGTGNFLSAWRATNSSSEQRFINGMADATEEFALQIDSLYMLRNKAVQDYISSNGEDTTARDMMKTVDAQVKEIQKSLIPLRFAYLKENYNSHFSVSELLAIAEYYTDIVPKEDVRAIYNKLDDTYKNTLYGEGLANQFIEVKVPQEGEMFVDLKLSDLQGNAHNLSDFKGKYMLLDFWSLGCYPCILAAPELREMQSKYADKLSIVGVSMDTKKNMWEEATERDSVTWTNLSDMKGTFGGAGVAYGISGFPTYILISPEGEIVKRWSGFGEGIFEEKIGEYLK